MLPVCCCLALDARQAMHIPTKFSSKPGFAGQRERHHIQHIGDELWLLVQHLQRCVAAVGAGCYQEQDSDCAGH